MGDNTNYVKFVAVKGVNMVRNRGQFLVHIHVHGTSPMSSIPALHLGYKTKIR